MRTLLWLQSDGQQQASYLRARDRLLAGVPGSEVLVVGGTSHTSFTDLPAYLSPTGTESDGRRRVAGPGCRDHGDLIAAFVRAPLAGPGDPMAASWHGTRPSDANMAMAQVLDRGALCFGIQFGWMPSRLELSTRRGLPVHPPGKDDQPEAPAED